MSSLKSVEGIVAEIQRVGDQCAPAQYVPLLRRCAIAHRDGTNDPGLAAEVSDYASILSMHGYVCLAENLRRAVPEAEPDQTPIPG